MPEISTDPTEQLVEQLKAVRRQVAAKAGVAAYLVFSDASLVDMARRRPSTPEQFLEVNGVGERKAVKYGRQFLAAIRKFEGLGALPQGTTYKETLILHNARVPLGDMASIKGVTTDTILGHIARLTDEDMITDFSAYISRHDFETITHTLADRPADGYTVLADQYPQGIIRLARSIAEYHKRHGR